MKKIIFNLTIILFLTSCATKIPFEQTCLTCVQSQRLSCNGVECPETMMVNGECIVLISETGEKVNVTQILTKEEITIKSGIPVTVAKIRGRYFLTGLGFKNLWMLTPVENEAKIKGYQFPAEGLTLPPVFEISNANLLMRGEKNEYSYIFDIDNGKWLINNYPKAGK